MILILIRWLDRLHLFIYSVSCMYLKSGRFPFVQQYLHLKRPPLTDKRLIVDMVLLVKPCLRWYCCCLIMHSFSGGGGGSGDFFLMLASATSIFCCRQFGRFVHFVSCRFCHRFVHFVGFGFCRFSHRFAHFDRQFDRQFGRFVGFGFCLFFECGGRFWLFCFFVFLFFECRGQF